MSDTLPEYDSCGLAIRSFGSASTPAPDYSCEPTSGERTLECAPLPPRRPRNSSFIKKAGKRTITLDNQEENIGIPRYGRAETISGSILFDSVESVSEVVVKIKGKLDTLFSEGGAKQTQLIDDQYTLWKENPNSPCPSQIPFSFKLPKTFLYGVIEETLPPSYHYIFYGPPGLYVKAAYSIRFLIIKTRSCKVDVFTKTEKIDIPFEYYPRTRPYRPIVHMPCFFSTIKYSPEEWHQTIALVKNPPHFTLDPLDIQLFIPVSRVYGLTDAIPFHIQLSGPRKSLRTFLRPGSQKTPRDVVSKMSRGQELPCDRVNSNDSCVTTLTTSSTTSSLTSSISRLRTSLSKTLRPLLHGEGNKVAVTEPSSSMQLSTTQSQGRKAPQSSENRLTLRIFVLRQVTVEHRDDSAWRNQIIGEGTILPVMTSPSIGCSTSSVSTASGEIDHLDWEGELRIDPKVKVGGWRALNVHVKDFIALSIVPDGRSIHPSPLHGLQLTVPIRLVSDTYSEVPDWQGFEGFDD